jgi:hypothetical protein
MRRAAVRPPKPAPTITTRGRDLPLPVVVGSDPSTIEIRTMAARTECFDEGLVSRFQYSPRYVAVSRSLRHFHDGFFETLKPEIPNLIHCFFTLWLHTLMTPAQPSPSALRFLLPSVRDIIFIFLFWSLLAGPLSNRPLGDADIGWHIRTGEQILATHSLPRTDSFSSTMQGQPWFAWEWLYDIVLGILHRACGLNGVVWLCALLFGRFRDAAFAIAAARHRSAAGGRAHAAG